MRGGVVAEKTKNFFNNEKYLFYFFHNFAELNDRAHSSNG
jgi:hypothetical protein